MPRNELARLDHQMSFTNKGEWCFTNVCLCFLNRIGLSFRRSFLNSDDRDFEGVGDISSHIKDSGTHLQ